MHAALANVVHPVIGRGLGLFARLQRGETPTLEDEQAALLGLLAADGVPDFGPDRDGMFLGRYALVCWLDELFILDSPWAAAWNENKIEARLYGSNDRAYRFWEQAQFAASRPSSDALEVFFICTLLGFSGDRIDDSLSLSGWVAATRLQLSQSRGGTWSPPPGLEPETYVPRLTGRGALRTMLAVAAGVMLVLIPAAAPLLARRGG